MVEACDVLCPLLSYALKSNNSNIINTTNKEDKVYGGDGSTESAMAILSTIGIIILVCFVLALVGMVKAFGCGGSPTSMGLTGTGWGALILVLVILVPPLGSLLGLVYAIAGKCQTMELSYAA